jgi:O-acetyl-ADP-ribose deacetylase (regulator of RNase III)
MVSAIIILSKLNHIWLSLIKDLQWLRDSYKKEKITSLAIPALGCGLGALTWEEIGTMMCHYLHDLMMCHYLHDLEIEVRIYLLREQSLTEDLFRTYALTA